MNKIEPVKIPATLDRVSTIQQGLALKVTFETQEIAPENMASLFELRNRLGWMVFAPNGTPEIELPNEPAMKTHEGKTPSQRLRNVLYRLWERNGALGNFNDWYEDYIEKRILEVKCKINDADNFRG